MRRYKQVLDDLNAAKMKLQQATQPKLDRRYDVCTINVVRDLEATVEDLELELLQTVRCRDCVHLREVYCHPWNKDVGKGSVIERFGWICVPPEFEDKTIFFDNTDGYCEMFEQKHSK